MHKGTLTNRILIRRDTEQALRTTIELPASKSLSNRVLILNGLSKSRLPVENLSESDDTNVLKEALEFITRHREGVIDVGAAGSSFRFLTAFLSQTPGSWTLTGSERMKQRPIGELVQALNDLGADIAYLGRENYPPLRINGRRLKGGAATVDASISSQFVSALLMIAPTMEEGLSIHLAGGMVSEPYVRMTLALMQRFGVEYAWDEHAITVPAQDFRPVSVRIESDWSAASYWYEIAALSPGEVDISLKGLCKDSLQGDAKTAQLFKPLGIKTTFTEEGIILQKSETTLPERMDCDFANEPDLTQTFAVTCCLLNIPFRFTGLQSLRIKETDRIEALKREMEKLGYSLDAADDSLSWDGSRCESQPDPVISTYDDHRMAMAFAPAAWRINELIIDNPFVVSKSYPYFWEDFKRSGLTVEDI